MTVNTSSMSLLRGDTYRFVLKSPASAFCRSYGLKSVPSFVLSRLVSTFWSLDELWLVLEERAVSTSYTYIGLDINAELPSFRFRAIYHRRNHTFGRQAQAIRVSVERHVCWRGKVLMGNCVDFSVESSGSPPSWVPYLVVHSQTTSAGAGASTSIW